jgi:hypothetical protein
LLCPYALKVEGVNKDVDSFGISAEFIDTPKPPLLCSLTSNSASFLCSNTGESGVIGGGVKGVRGIADPIAVAVTVLWFVVRGVVRISSSPLSDVRRCGSERNLNCDEGVLSSDADGGREDDWLQSH